MDEIAKKPGYVYKMYFLTKSETTSKKRKELGGQRKRTK